MLSRSVAANDTIFIGRRAALLAHVPAFEAIE
jgi:hypothetical protein